MGRTFSQVEISQANKLSYFGSLTTPPCSPNILFIVPASPIELGWLDHNNLKSLIKFNSRPVQNNPGFGNALLDAARDISNCSSSTSGENDDGKGLKEDNDQEQKGLFGDL